MTALFYFPSREERRALAEAAAPLDRFPELPLPPSTTMQPVGVSQPDGRRRGENPSQDPAQAGSATAGPRQHGVRKPASCSKASGGENYPAVADILAERRRAAFEFGHTPDADLRLPLATLPQEARNYLIDAIDELQRGRDRHAIARRKLVKGGALLLAAIDRLDAEPTASEGGLAA